MASTTGLHTNDHGQARCHWCVIDPLYIAYHDEEWGFPQADDTRLFEKICLEGFQAGLSWWAILRKRENFRRALAGFDIEKVARFTPRDVTRLLRNEGIVRNRAKIESAINNARRAIELIEERGSLAAHLWNFEPPIRRRPSRMTWAMLRRRVVSRESIALSKDLKKRGWTFVGPTTMYALMQAMGMVNDHLTGCMARESAEKSSRQFLRPTARIP